MVPFAVAPLLSTYTSEHPNGWCELTCSLGCLPPPRDGKREVGRGQQSREGMKRRKKEEQDERGGEGRRKRNKGTDIGSLHLSPPLPPAPTPSYPHWIKQQGTTLFFSRIQYRIAAWTLAPLNTLMPTVPHGKTALPWGNGWTAVL